jgi:hypothetical protein
MEGSPSRRWKTPTHKHKHKRHSVSLGQQGIYEMENSDYGGLRTKTTQGSREEE